MIKNCFAKAILLVSFALFSVSAQEGRLTVTTDPEGVEVWLDENYIGNSPITERKFPVGKYTVRLVDPIQRISQMEQIMITAGQSVVLEKKLDPKFGTLKVNTVPEGAQVFLSVPLGKTPVSNDFIIPGKYLLQIKYPDHSSSKNVTVNKNAPVVVSDTMPAVEPPPRKPLFTTKAWIRLGLGAGAIGSFVWALVEHGKVNEFRYENKNEKAATASLLRALGITTGSLCVIGFEVVAFF
ncbi:MAG: PEGA domain-containing protein [Chitinispirillaceae bacterium]